MTDQARRKTLWYLLAVLGLTILMAVALPSLELKPGLPLPGLVNNSASAPAGDILPVPVVTVSTFWRAVVGILLAAALAYNAYKLLRTARWSWKEVLRSLLVLSLAAFVVVGLVLILSGAQITLESAPAETPPPVVEVKGPPLGAVPSVLIWLVCLALAAALAGLGLWLVFRRPARPDPLRLEAERALQALKAGLDLRNVIVHCYWQMAQVLKQEQGLELKAAMTVREFQRLLEARGMPPAPVRQLTQLFEAARYSPRPPGPDEERQAVDCLTAIVRYSQARRRSG